MCALHQYQSVFTWYQSHLLHQSHLVFFASQPNGDLQLHHDDHQLDARR
jgi:hypothetical protein